MHFTKMHTRILLLLIAVLAIFFTTQCKKDKQTEQEVITRVIVHLTGVGTSFDEEFTAEDADGDGIFNSVDTIVLPPGLAFDAHLHVFDDSKTPTNDVGTEIEAENIYHLFEYKIATPGLFIGNLNTDDAGLPFGLESTWSTTAAAQGTVRILLHHEPVNKSAADPGGDIDFDVTFPVRVQ